MILQADGPPSRDWLGNTRDLVELVKAADRVGIDRFGISDRPYSFDLVALLGACAVSTRRLTMASLVTNPFYRHPTVTATTFATLADLTKGRVVLGLAGGVEQPSHWGEDRSKPLAAMREAVQIIRGMWKGETVSFEGKVIKATGAKLNFRLNYRIPILIASRSPRSLEFAGEIGDIALIGSRFYGKQHYLDNYSHIKRGIERSGRRTGDVEIDTSAQSCVCDDEDLALAFSRSFVAMDMLYASGKDSYSKRNYKKWTVPSGFAVPDKILRAVTSWNPWANMMNLPDRIGSMFTREIYHQFAVSGTPKQVAERYREIMGYPHIGGIRIRLIPVKRADRTEGYFETVRGLSKVTKLLKQRRSLTAGTGRGKAQSLVGGFP